MTFPRTMRICESRVAETLSVNGSRELGQLYAVALRSGLLFCHRSAKAGSSFVTRKMTEAATLSLAWESTVARTLSLVERSTEAGVFARGVRPQTIGTSSRAENPSAGGHFRD